MVPPTPPLARIDFDNSYYRDLEGFYVPCQGHPAPAPGMIRFNVDLAHSLGLDVDALSGKEGAAIFAASRTPEGAAPLAQVYAGHQFGGFSPQLGDGRALLLGEVIDRAGIRRDIHLKGSGKTPFSRGGDGKATLGPVLREYIIAEAMHALNIPTTRALAAVTTGEEVIREVPLPGAVLTRVAASHIRVGTFQFFAARGETDRLRQLADYAINRHFPKHKKQANPYLALLASVRDAQAALIARWMLVGFVHGVMNTDNMTISGETIDYGPCAFIDGYSPDALFSSIDAHGRYAFKNQPRIAQWNLARLAEALLPLIDPDSSRAVEKATQVLDGFSGLYTGFWLEGMRGKLGLSLTQADDLDLAEALLSVMQAQTVDFTLLFRGLGAAAQGDNSAVLALFSDPSDIKPWLTRWHKRLALEPDHPADRAALMNRNNPVYIPRNHLVEAALSAAVDHGDFSAFETLVTVLAHPFSEQERRADFAKPPPADFGPYRTFCGT